MNLNQLRYVIKVAETGSINRAASNLFISQSVLSTSIRNLENELGHEIFIRSSKGIEITPYGRIFLSYITPIEQQLQLLDGFLYRERTPSNQTLSVVSSGFPFVTHICANLYQKYVEECAKNIGSIGYYAQQKVLENQMDGNDYYTLLQIVEAEATGGDIKSKILIANVVLNRVKDSRFPDTIYDVVWQTAGGSPQFSPTDDGRIYTVSITDDTIEAVDRALAGEDYSQGALFFAARASAEAQNMVWFDQNLVQMFEYGGHEFFCFADE